MRANRKVVRTLYGMHRVTPALYTSKFLVARNYIIHHLANIVKDFLSLRFKRVFFAPCVVYVTCGFIIFRRKSLGGRFARRPEVYVEKIYIF